MCTYFYKHNRLQLTTYIQSDKLSEIVVFEKRTNVKTTYL